MEFSCVDLVNFNFYGWPSLSIILCFLPADMLVCWQFLTALPPKRSNSGRALAWSPSPWQSGGLEPAQQCSFQLSAPIRLHPYCWGLHVQPQPGQPCVRQLSSGFLPSDGFISLVSLIKCGVQSLPSVAKTWGSLEILFHWILRSLPSSEEAYKIYLGFHSSSYSLRNLTKNFFSFIIYFFI